MVLEWLRYGKPSVLGIVTGMVAGLGTITPASGFVGPGGAVVIGAAAGLICLLATGGVTWLLLKLIDATLGLRVTEEQESEGLDLALHGERGYIE